MRRVVVPSCTPLYSLCSGNPSMAWRDMACQCNSCQTWKSWVFWLTWVLCIRWLLLLCLVGEIYLCPSITFSHNSLFLSVRLFVPFSAYYHFLTNFSSICSNADDGVGAADAAPRAINDVPVRLIVVLILKDPYNCLFLSVNLCCDTRQFLAEQMLSKCSDDYVLFSVVFIFSRSTLILE